MNALLDHLFQARPGLYGVLFFVLGACAQPQVLAGGASQSPEWATVQGWSVTTQANPAPASLRGISSPGNDVVWVSGSDSTVLRSLDGGNSWQTVPAPGQGQLDFRDIHALDHQTAWLMAAGSGEASRIYATTDGGLHWQLQLMNPDPNGFFDSFAFWDGKNALLLGDPIENRFTLYRTKDGGQSWQQLAESSRPEALPGEHCFAASGTALVIAGTQHAWIATGGSQARILRSVDGGASWQAATTPIAAGTPSQGIFSLAFRDLRHGIAIGGDYADPENATAICARTTDGGRTWALVDGSAPTGYRSGLSYVAGSSPAAWVSLGTHGADYSLDDGRNWLGWPDLSSGNAILFGDQGLGWAVGGVEDPLRRIAALFEERRQAP
jgi:photosystem II stability/assembly factor-like uncharacterized protein